MDRASGKRLTSLPERGQRQINRVQNPGENMKGLWVTGATFKVKYPRFCTCRSQIETAPKNTVGSLKILRCFIKFAFPSSPGSCVLPVIKPNAGPVHTYLLNRAMQYTWLFYSCYAAELRGKVARLTDAHLPACICKQRV